VVSFSADRGIRTISGPDVDFGGVGWDVIHRGVRGEFYRDKLHACLIQKSQIFLRKGLGNLQCSHYILKEEYGF
jgi:hypothetical protein